jgi:hypothetical protein
MNTLEKAELLEAVHHQQNPDRFNSSEHSIFIVTNDGLKTMETGTDVYDIIENPTNQELVHDLGCSVAITTQGWASPRNTETDDDVAPSQHPQRRRVALFVMVTQSGEMASVLRFSDKPNETVTDDGEARGSLAEALLEMVSA